MERFIQKYDIPSSLWCNKTKIMSLPPLLIEHWKKLLVANDLDELAKMPASNGFEGGESKDDTNKHLAWRYNGSCGRIILSLLDPEEQLEKVSDAYASIFAGSKVFLADLPSGSGAAIVSILTTLSELRSQGVIPRMPLSIVIVAGELSETARGYLKEQLDSLTPLLEEQAIWIEYKILAWDVLDKISTADLIKELILQSQNCHSKLLLLSNFTGFLEGKGKWKQAKPQFDNLFIYSRDKLSASIWIEPQKNNVFSFSSRVKEWFTSLFNKKSDTEDTLDEENWYAQAEIKFQQPIKEGKFPVRLTVMKFDLSC